MKHFEKHFSTLHYEMLVTIFYTYLEILPWVPMEIHLYVQNVITSPDLVAKFIRARPFQPHLRQC